MSHELRRVLRAFAAQPWFIEARAAEKIVAILEFRAANGPRAAPYREEPAGDRQVAEQRETIAVVNLHGPIVPRSSGVDDVSGPTVASMERFGKAFDQAAANENVTAIVLNVDSPGGAINLVPEIAAKIRAARDPGRPIIAVANTLMASAAYWIGSAADELVVSPSGEVGSIGAYMIHEDVSKALENAGVKMTFIAEGPRKTEGNPFEPLGEEAAAALQETVRYHYDRFVKDVAKHRGVSAAVVRADPEKSEKHFGGGRVYPADTAVRLGMADRVDTLEGVIRRLQGKGGGRSRGKRAEARPIILTRTAAGAIVAGEEWPEAIRLTLALLSDPAYPIAVDGDIATITTANGWARYRLGESVGTDVIERDVFEADLIASHWQPAAAPKARRADVARRRLALI